MVDNPIAVCATIRYSLRTVRRMPLRVILDKAMLRVDVFKEEGNIQFRFFMQEILFHIYIS